MNSRISLSDLVARLESAEHAIAYFNKPLPEILLDGLRLLAERRGRGSVGLPQETLVIVDRIQGYWLATDTDAGGGALVAADNAPELYIKLLWRRFGMAASYEGQLKEIYPDTGFFCVGLEEQQEIFNDPDGESNLILPRVDLSLSLPFCAAKISVFIGFGLWHIHCPR